jgi:hypothetical protein
MTGIQIEIDLLFYQNHLRLRREQNRSLIYDPIRRQYFVQTPEEVVRQLLIQYFLEEKKFPQNRIAVEKLLKVENQAKRFDLLVFDKNAQPWMLVECKNPDIRIDEGALLQAVWYNKALRVPYLLLTNGEMTNCWEIQYADGTLVSLESIPDW